VQDDVSSRFRINKKGDKMNLKLSNQAIGAIMMALQKGIMEQTDITDLLRGFELIQTTDGLVVENPPLVKVQESSEQEETSA
jgi:hypothetical protein